MCFDLVCLCLRLDLVALQVAALHEQSCLSVVQLRCALCPSVLGPQPSSLSPSDTLPPPLNLFSFSHWTRMVRTVHHWHHGRSGVSSSILGSRAQVAFFSLGPSPFLRFHSSLHGPS